MNTAKTVADLQKEVDKFIKAIGDYWDPFQMFTAIVEEVGELAKELELSHDLRPSEEAVDLEIEVGDVFFTLICFANAHDISLEQALKKTLAKYRKRDKEDWQQRATKERNEKP